MRPVNNRKFFISGLSKGVGGNLHVHPMSISRFSAEKGRKIMQTEEACGKIHSGKAAVIFSPGGQ